jgi:large subunit ribosomal protein L10Ae
MTQADLMKLNKDKKQIRKLGHKYNYFIASDTVIKQLPKILGPGLNKTGKFPTPVTHTEDLNAKINEIKSQVKFQLKKAVCLNAPIANVNMTDADIIRNLNVSVNFLVSLLKKNWHNIRCIYIKSTMSPSQQLY